MPSHLNNILICRLIPDQAPGSRRCCDTAFGVLHCLSRATANPTDLVAVIVTSRDTRYHQEVVELCKILKAHPLTAKAKLAVILERIHRKFIEAVHETGVDFAVIHTGSEPGSIDEKICRYWQTRSFTPVQKILETLCPFLEYIRSGDEYDFPVCGAYRNRMVLGGNRLHEICHTMTHRHCEYFLNPRRMS